MSVALAIDFGSTYTKAVAIDVTGESVLGVAQAPSTVTTDVTIGLRTALERLHGQCGVALSDMPLRVASSSAAGGLRMVAIGLVPELTVEAARRAALGAGAKVVGVFGYTLSRRDADELRRLAPDIVLLAGGTDGGDRKTIGHNAGVLASLRLDVPVVVAGNRTVADDVQAVLQDAGYVVRVVDNVMPEIGRIEVEPAQGAIRDTFMERIVAAKGLDRAEALVGRVAMPTPRAVLEAARLLADGDGDDAGLGELLVLDVGGATTDVHSVGRGEPTEATLVPRGLPEPYAKRTVEGDLGIRVNAPSILETVGAARILQFAGGGLAAEAVEHAVERLGRETSHVPVEPWEHGLDAALARCAVALAIDRHVGRVDVVATPTGPVRLLTGKDMRRASALIGTGGIFAYGRGSQAILEGALADPGRPLSLRPLNPALLVDTRYILFALGLLAPEAKGAAIRIGKRHLTSGGTDAHQRA
jgi:uncharacterized protein (TIGR01319 family)